jgi:drug/metabolite transporter (DMT)-like permease
MATKRPVATAAFLAAYWVLGTLGGLCFKEGGTDAQRWLLCFLVGNVLGITSTVMLMGVYARMNVNVGLVVAGSGAFVLLQFALWAVYRAPLTPLQWAGILAVAAGTALASRPAPARAAAEPAEPEGAAGARAQPEGATGARPGPEEGRRTC